MPQFGPAEIIFTLLIGSFALALTILSVRETFLRQKSR